MAAVLFAVHEGRAMKALAMLVVGMVRMFVVHAVGMVRMFVVHVVGMVTVFFEHVMGMVTMFVVHVLGTVELLTELTYRSVVVTLLVTP